MQLNRSTPGGWMTGLLLCWLCALGSGCVQAGGGWRVDDLGPNREAVGKSRIDDLLPHFMLERDSVTLFLCRWKTEGPISVSLPDDATQEEELLLGRALDAWARAGLGVRFSRAAPGAAQIEIRFADALDGLPASPSGWMPDGTGDTVADCRVKGDLDRSLEQSVVEAELQFASVHLRRFNEAMTGRVVRISADELMGSALHELGHALGFGAHVALGKSVMRLETQRVRRIGARVNRGEAFSDPNLSALYALPTGVVVGHRTVPEDRLDELSRLAVLAHESNLEGPFSRAGDSNARLFWRRDDGVAIAIRAIDWNLQMRDRIPLDLRPNASALMLLRDSTAR